MTMIRTWNNSITQNVTRGTMSYFYMYFQNMYINIVMHVCNFGVSCALEVCANFFFFFFLLTVMQTKVFGDNLYRQWQ